MANAAPLKLSRKELNRRLVARAVAEANHPSWAKLYKIVDRGAKVSPATGDWMLFTVEPIDGESSGLDAILAGYETREEAQAAIDSGLVLDCDPNMSVDVRESYAAERAKGVSS